MIQTAIFDVGETLVDAEELFPVLAQHMGSLDLLPELRQHFATRLQKEPFITVKAALAEAVEEIAQRTGREHIDAAHIYYNHFVSNAKLFPDVVPTLRCLRNHGLRLIICSDADADVLWPELERLGLTAFFDDIIISSEVRAYKPSPAMVRAVEHYT